MDIAGPYRKSRYALDRHFIITLTDRFTGYVLVKCVNYDPVTTTCIQLFRRVLNVFNSCPEVVHTDNGSVFTSLEWLTFVNTVHCTPVRSPVGASWCNGLVERTHRMFHEHLLTRLEKIETLGSFRDVVHSIVQNHNTSVGRRKGVSPHHLVFHYEPWIFPQIPLHLRSAVFQSSSEEGSSRTKLPEHAIAANPNRRRPAIGEVWLVRRADIGEEGLMKLSRPFAAARVKKVISKSCYDMLFKGNKTRIVHLRHMKRVNQELEGSLPADEMPPPL